MFIAILQTQLIVFSKFRFSRKWDQKMGSKMGSVSMNFIEKIPSKGPLTSVRFEAHAACSLGAAWAQNNPARSPRFVPRISQGNVNIQEITNRTH